MRLVKPAGRNLVSDRFASLTCGTSVKSRSKSFPLARALRLGPAGACKRPTPLVELTRLNPIRRMANAFAHLTEVPLEKEVEKGADDRNGSYAANVFPARAIEVSMMSAANWKVNPSTSQRPKRSQTSPSSTQMPVSNRGADSHHERDGYYHHAPPER